MNDRNQQCKAKKRASQEPSVDTQNIDQWLDPQYVQVSRKEAARILGRSTTEFDRLRMEDPECPKGFKESDHRQGRVYFRLSDIYEYSDRMMERAERE